jgi:hypothetical protein
VRAIVIIASGLLLIMLAYAWWPHEAGPATWAEGPDMPLRAAEPTADNAPRLYAKSTGELSIDVVVACAAAPDGNRILDVRLRTQRDGANAKMHTHLINLENRSRHPPRFVSFGAAEISADGGPAQAVDLYLDATGSSVTLALVRDTKGFRIGQRQPAEDLDFFLRQGLTLHTERRLAIRLPVAETSAVARLSTVALANFHATCR